MMTFGSLFAGIGGIDLGLERAGMVCRWQSEIDPYACQVLAKHWPDIPNLGDIRDIDWTRVERTDLVAGGYPCQPFSYAGRRAGEDDPRHLWPLFAECLRVVRPRYALLENVTGHLSLGFGSVLSDLAEIGYDARWDCVPAAAVGAPHSRDRVFVIATRRHSMEHTDQGNGRPPVGTVGTTTDWGHNPARPRGEQLERRPRERGEGTEWGPYRPRWTPEPGVGRVADGIPRRLDRLSALGNAVVPQVAEHLGRIILRMETPT